MAKETKGKGKKKDQPVTTPAETPVIGWRIEAAEYAERVARTRQVMEERKLDALVLFHPLRIAYLSGFFHITTERPMAIVVTHQGGLGALVPQLEQEHVAKSAGVDRVKVYPEYPTGGAKHPLYHLADLLTEMGVNTKGKRVGYDSNGHLDANGYDGPDLTELLDIGVKGVRARDIVDTLRYVKSDMELLFIRESCVWGNLAHRLMHQKLELGRTEIEISSEASTEASRAMVAALGPGYQPLTNHWGSPATVGFSAGANTFYPHGLSHAIGLRRGDILVTGSGADVGGYNSELERTMIIGDPTPEFEKYFGLMMQLQQVAFDALKPGRTLSDVEADISRAFKDLGVADHQRHHTGHGIGLDFHEAPFIDKGDDTVLAERMCFTIEPGIYVPALGGFRHSDTVVIRSFGAERLTFYPRDLESMTVLL
ncbi:MAG: M24 family metallopeptidase [Thermomicrobiales bacterium]